MDDKQARWGLAQLILNIAYTVVGLVILGIGVGAWLIKTRRNVLVPCIFALAAVMCVLHMVDLIRNMPRGKKNWNGVLITMAGVPMMIAMSVLTYICLR